MFLENGAVTFLFTVGLPWEHGYWRYRPQCTLLQVQGSWRCKQTTVWQSLGEYNYTRLGWDSTKTCYSRWLVKSHDLPSWGSHKGDVAILNPGGEGWVSAGKFWRRPGVWRVHKTLKKRHYWTSILYGLLSTWNLKNILEGTNLRRCYVHQQCWIFKY